MEHWADYVIFVAFLVISLGIGVYHALAGGRQRTTEEFIMADRKLKVIPTTLSLVSSFISAILILGSPAEFYRYGIMQTAWHFTLYPGIAFAALFLVPLFYPLKLTSVFEYFGMRYECKAIRYSAVILGIFQILCYMGVVIYGPAIALETATGFPMYGSIPIMAAVCTIYTTIGGMKAVIWTDAFQTTVMIVGIVTALVKGCVLVGGLGHAWDIAGQEGRLLWYNLSPNPTVRHTIWGFLISSPLGGFHMFGFNQAAVQRYSALPTLSSAMRSLFLVVPVFLTLIILSVLSGIVVFAYFSLKGCDPILSKQISSPNQLLPLFVKETFRGISGFSGLFMATLFSGALSSASSGLSACAAILWRDIVQQHLPNMSDLNATRLNKLFVILFGLMSAGIAYLAAKMPGPIMQVSAALGSSTSGPLLAMLLIAATYRLRWVEGRTVFAGGLLSFCIMLWIIMGSMTIKGQNAPLPHIQTDQCHEILNTTVFFGNFTHYQYDPFEGSNSTQTQNEIPELYGVKRLYSMSYMWYKPLGMILTLVIAATLSLILKCIGKNKPCERVPDNLFIDVMAICKYYKKTEVKDHVELTDYKENVNVLQ